MPREFANTKPNLEAALGYHIKNADLFRLAITHGSRSKSKSDYQRLEFLGDRVLSLVIADELYHLHTDQAEGYLAARLSSLVRGQSCAAVGVQLALGDMILVGHSEKQKGVQHGVTLVGDVVEALIGAIYLDGGIDEARKFILREWGALLNASPLSLKDPKTFVQEWALGQALALPAYVVTGREGLEHAPIFTVSLKVGVHDEAVGVGPSKQQAEMAAAQNFIAREGLR
ncbi:MAG: ribonuclease III [Alphaproteobacteria bacterium]|nr:ribonuclease III [Alphaproteobacteria bacterium]